MKAHLILVMLLAMAVATVAEAHATDDSASTQPKDEPNFEPKVTKDPTNEKIEIIEFACKLK